MGKRRSPALKINLIEDDSEDTAAALNALYVRAVERCLNDSYLSYIEKMLVLDGMIALRRKKRKGAGH